MTLKEKLETYLSNRLKSRLEIRDFFSLSGGGGACQDNYSFGLQIDSGEWQGFHELVLRTDKGGSLYASISKEDEFSVTSLAYSHGVKTPRPYWLEKDSSFTGNPFFIMQKITGKANGRYVVKDAGLNKIRSSMPIELAENLAKIHSITPKDCSDEKLQKVLSGGKPLDNNYSHIAVEVVRKEVESLSSPHPAMELILIGHLKTHPIVTRSYWFMVTFVRGILCSTKKDYKVFWTGNLRIGVTGMKILVGFV